MTPDSIHIIPARLNFHVVYNLEEEKEIGVYDDIIAWKVATYYTDKGVPFSSVHPIISTGDPADNAIGIYNPKGSIHLYSGDFFPSLKALQKQYYPETYE